ncbi:MAG: LytR C-terminal domain-containing protein [Nocardioidaceae bacterium]|nr:LytR C-terminal domain-containing protein [Nocardioidaceae bacterium]
MPRALPSWVVAVCAALVVGALVAFVVSGERGADVSASPPADSDAEDPRPAPEPDPETDPETDPGTDPRTDPGAPSAGPRGAGDKPDDNRPTKTHGSKKHGNKKAPPPVERRTAYVEVYNNSGLTGLAGDTAAVLQDSGWRVVATDNWYGAIPANTIYYPAALRAQAALLARDLGVDRMMPAVAPMSFDRITVILTGTL